MGTPPRAALSQDTVFLFTKRLRSTFPLSWAGERRLSTIFWRTEYLISPYRDLSQKLPLVINFSVWFVSIPLQVYVNLVDLMTDNLRIACASWSLFLRCRCRKVIYLRNCCLLVGVQSDTFWCPHWTVSYLEEWSFVSHSIGQLRQSKISLLPTSVKLAAGYLSLHTLVPAGVFQLYFSGIASWRSRQTQVLGTSSGTTVVYHLMNSRLEQFSWPKVLQLL